MTGEGNNTYLLVGKGGDAALIDAGVGDPRHLSELARHLVQHRASLTRVLVTHAHADHAAGAKAISAAYPQARFYKYPWPEEDSKYGVSWGWFAADEETEAAGEALRAIHTAGHSPDHVIFWHARSRTAFTGDLVVRDGSMMIEATRGGDLTTYLQALEDLRQLRPARLLPAHGPPIDDPDAVVTRYLEHRRARERQVLEALAAGLDSVPAIAESIYHGLAAALIPAARQNVQAHLDKLEAEGRAVQSDGRWRL